MNRYVTPIYIYTCEIIVYFTIQSMQERLHGISMGIDDFSLSIRRHVPRGQSFKAFPILFNHTSPERILDALLASPVARSILEVRLYIYTFMKICLVLTFLFTDSFIVQHAMGSSSAGDGLSRGLHSDLVNVSHKNRCFYLR